MDVFAADDKVSLDLEDPINFWREIDRLSDVEALTDDQIEGSSHHGAHSGVAIDADHLHERMSSLLALCDEWYDIHIDHSTNRQEVLERITESPLFKNATNLEISDVLITQVTSVKTLPALHLLFEALLFLGSRHPEVYQSRLAITQLIPRLVHHFWAARYAEEYIEREAEGKGGGNAEADDVELDWNVRHIRNVSMGDTKKQKKQARDRRLQCKLRDESVILLYEVCRAQRLEHFALRSIDATFVNHLFDLVEASRHWHDDSYNYQLIKLIVALNEQFMVSAIDSAVAKGSSSKRGNANHSNIVMTVLRTRLNASNTFGENLIWMLNRASSLSAEDVCMQLLVLKLLYLLFTTRETAHYLYTNDLKVLVDVFIRELSDLPEDSESLRHTYLRVLHPLLTNTQLLTYSYKRDQIRQLLVGLTSNAHLRDISSTTKRLVDRCLNAQWCVDLEDVDARETAGNKVACSIERENHTFTVQTIAGGPKSYVQAPIVYDGEGISIPMGAHREPYQGAPSSASSTFAIAATYLPDRITAQDSQDPEPTLTALPQSDNLLYPRLRDRRVNSFSSDLELQTYRESFNEEESKSESGESSVKSSSVLDLTLRREASASSPLTTRRDLGQRSSSARSAPMSANPSSTLHRTLSQQENNEQEYALNWSEGSGSSTWHLGMAGIAQSASSPTTASHPPHDFVRYGSPLSHESMSQQQSTLSTPPIHPKQQPDTKRNEIFEAPTLQVQQILEDEGIVSVKAESSSGHSSTSASRRRRPPAPPRSDNGDATSRLERRAMLSSTSESNLHSSSSSSSLTNKKDYLSIHGGSRDMVSLPSSPRAESREGSPILDNALTSSKRRRPPPPPVNRSTKGSIRTVSTQSSADQYGDNRRSAEEERPQQRYQQNNTEDANPDHLTKSMDYLYVSEGGYGW
ncbi:hypothetical protein CBS101457_004122 [Exobasidium rhododendri]|nr:hypothetical protein CBS101457_004122 [Exobasidium rhododendri]